ncbi:uncharacterized protein LOC122285205 isoform X8 [Carya illinoinensis]|uniref:uncharacterized protein LOC122285205 isoform X8 n=1 Tax=Carya illinoinensis TaxID=32201 RepID=UPI001C72513A|nr:uncharacterized protein LOC122285205 isoform X8 [Carya illinoinensis]
MTSFEGDLEEQLKEAGNKLINPPSSIDELLNLLDKVENLLANVEQAPSESMKDALLPSMKALITVELLRHSEMDVKVSVASCITEITRITAPDAPYNDEQMKEIFQLTVAAFESFSHASTRCYTKTVSILETVARVRSCLVMLDLECDTLVVEMFQNFLKLTRSNPPLSVFSAMETIMTMVIEESEEISLDLLIPLLSSVKKENQAHENKLGKQPGSSEPLQIFVNQVIKGLAPDTVCCTKIGQSVDGTLKSVMSNFAKNDNTFKKEKISKSLHRLLTRHNKSISARSNAEPGSVDSKKATKSEIQRVSLPKKRGRKPNFVMNPEEGYDHILISTGRKTTNVRCRKSHDGGGVDDSPSENLDPGKVTSSLEDVTELSDFQPKINKIVIAAAPFTDHSLPDASHPTSGQPKQKGNTVNQDANPNSLSRSKKRYLNSRVGEKASQSVDLSLKKEYEVLHNSNTKPQGHTRKIRIATKTKEETTLALGYVVSEKEVAVPYIPAEKPLRPSAMNSRSSIRMFIKKRKRDNATCEKDITEASNRKMISKSASKSTDRDGSYLEETSKTKLRRKHTATKEKSSKKFDLGERLVGSSIKVWWPLDKIFYEGLVNFYDPVKKKHQVLYADGDEEILNLKKERWQLVGDNVLPGGQGTDLPELYATCDLPEKRKGKVKSQSAKRQKVDASSKRIQASDGIFKVVKPTKSVDDPSKADDGHKKFTGKLRIEKLKAGTRLKQNIPKTVTLPKGFL